jgi:hypothetical protein
MGYIARGTEASEYFPRFRGLMYGGQGMVFLRHGGKRMFPLVMEIRKTFCPMFVQRLGDNFTMY